MKRLHYILTIPFFLALPLGAAQAQQSPSWFPPASQPSQYDSQHQNVLEIAPAQQATSAEPQQSYDTDSSLQASVADDPWYRHQETNFDDPYYQQRRARDQEIQIAQQETYRPSEQQELAYADQYNEYDRYDQTPLTSTPQPVQTYPSTVSQAPSALWDVARIATLVAGYQSGLVRYDSCRRQYYFAGVPIR